MQQTHRTAEAEETSRSFPGFLLSSLEVPAHTRVRAGLRKKEAGSLEWNESSFSSATLSADTFPNGFKT